MNSFPDKVSVILLHLITCLCFLVAVQSLIAEEESKGISRDRILIGGFSMGGAVALYTAFAVAKPPVGGIVALSSWMPMHQQFTSVSALSFRLPN